METEDTGNHLFTSEIEIVTCTNCESVEFYLDMSEWDSIYISSNERMSLTSNWTNVFTAKFLDLTQYCPSLLWLRHLYDFSAIASGWETSAISRCK